MAPLITERSVGGNVEDGLVSEVKPGDKELRLEVMTSCGRANEEYYSKEFKMPKPTCLMQFTLFGSYFTFSLLVEKKRGEYI